MIVLCAGRGDNGAPCCALTLAPMTDITQATKNLPVVCNDEACRKQAEGLAAQLRQPLLLMADPEQLIQTEFVLLVDGDGVALQQTGRKAPGPIRADFVGGAVDHRRKFGGGKGQMIARAAGIKAGVYPQILDVTAGLGRDAFVLATLGCRVQMLERSPVVYALLQDGLHRAHRMAAAEDPALLDILQRMELLPADSRDYLAQLGNATAPDTMLPDVIYMDPMFPEREKSADVKKEMRAFHSLVGKDEDADELLALCLTRARYRVVVKRPRKAPFVGDRPPSFQLEGKSSRFDIYTLRKLPDSLPPA